VTIVVEPVPEALFSGEDVCIGDTLDFTNLSQPQTGVTYQWAFGNGFVSTATDPSVFYRGAGTFTVTLTVTQGICSAQYVDSVTVHPRPDAAFLPEPRMATAIEPLIRFENLSSGAVQWQWDFGDGSGTSDEEQPNYAYSDTGRYTITLVAISEYGCEDTASDAVTITPFTTLYVPSAFTPDTDGVNDTFLAFGADMNAFSMQIFDRWGRGLFVSEDITVGWDGREMVSGKELPPGVYVYLVTYQDFRGRIQQTGGKVTLIR
jgi:gliding motility-associated-like protein